MLFLLLDKVENEDLKKVLEKQYKKYLNIANKISKI